MVYATELGVRVNWDDSRIQSGMHRTEGDIRGFMANVKASLAQGIGQGLGQIGFSSIAQGIKQVGMTMLNSNAQFEDFNSQFEVLLGSAEKAGKFYKELNAFSAATPFEMPELASAAQMMLSFGIEVNKLMPSLKMIGDVSLGNKGKFQGLSLAFAQVQATGRLMGQDLMQMVNQGFNPLTIISQKTGISMGDLKQKMEKGAISAEMVAEAFRIATSEGGRFYQGMEKGSKTFNGLKSTVSDLFNQLVREIGEPLFIEAKKGLVKIVELLGNEEAKTAIKNVVNITLKVAAFGLVVGGAFKALSVFKGLAPVFSAVGSALITMAGQSGAIIGLSKGATMAAGAMGFLKAAFVAITGPIGIAIGAIAALTAAYISNFAGFKTFVDGLVRDVSSFIQEIIGYLKDFARDNQDVIEWVKQYWDLQVKWLGAIFKTLIAIVDFAWQTIKSIIRAGLDVISGTIKFFRAVFKGDWQAAWDAATDVLKSVWNNFVVIVWNAILAIMRIIDSFSDVFAGMFGTDFTALDGAMKYAEGVIKDYESQVKKSHGEIRKEVKKTAEEQKKATKESAGMDFGKAFGAGKDKKKSSAKETNEITKELLLGIAKGIKTPSGVASCGYFASEMLKQTGAQIKGTGGAKALIEQVKKAGGYEVNAGQAKAGDLVYYRGSKFGSQKYNEGGQRVGYHVGIYRGDGYVVDSSGGKTRLARELGSEAKFIRPKRTGKYSNVDEASVKQIEEYNRALEDQSQIAKNHKQTMEDLWREQLRLNGSKQSAIFQWEYERGLHPQITKAQYQQRLEAMKYNESLSAEISMRGILEQKRKAVADDVSSYVTGAIREIELTEGLTEAERMLWETRKGSYKDATLWQKMFLIATAVNLDKTRREAAGLKAYKEALSEVNQTMGQLSSSTKEAAIAAMVLKGMTTDQAEEIWGKQERVRGFGAYKAALKEINDETIKLSLGSEEAAISLLMLNESMSRSEAEDIVRKRRELTGATSYKEAIKELNKEMLQLNSTAREWQIIQLMNDEAMTRAQAEEIVNRKESINRLKEYKEMLESIAGKATDVLMDSIEALRGGFNNFFKAMIDGFRKMLYEIAMQYLRSQVFKLLLRLAGSFGGGGGSGIGNDGGDTLQVFPKVDGMLASGGYMNSRGVYLVGEDGPELVSPTSNSFVHSSQDTSRILNSSSRSAGETVINLGGIVINGVTDFESFKKNKGQMAADMYSLLGKFSRRNG